MHDNFDRIMLRGCNHHNRVPLLTLPDKTDTVEISPNQRPQHFKIRVRLHGLGSDEEFDQQRLLTRTLIESIKLLASETRPANTNAIILMEIVSDNTKFFFTTITNLFK